MKASAFVGMRYYRSRSSNRFVSLVTLVSFIGLVLGVAALIVVVSVMNGFDRELKTRILGVVPHVIVKAAIPPEIAGKSAPFKSADVLLVTRNGSHLLTLYGIDPLAEHPSGVLMQAIGQDKVERLIPDQLRVVLGRSIASRFGVQAGDSVNLVLPAVSASGQNISPQLSSALVAGTFSVGSEMDYRLGVAHVSQVSQLLDEPADVKLTLNNIFDAPMKADDLRLKGYQVSSWVDDFGDFFQTVWMEKVMMFVLLTFVIAIASFSIVSGLTMLVATKRRDIAVLRTMGMTERGVLKVFLVQGLGLATVGVASGCLLGLVLAAYAPSVMGIVEELTGFSIVAGTYFDQIPTDIRWPDIFVIAIVTFLISFAATLYPSWRAAKLQPAAILRNE
ncbi:MAG: FtsX-like permease family protein [Pseudomonadales bacterium]|nr:FtsX-like permease family protein [Pseudomonadales bacterium]MBO6595406.1 FtsX-like permease family protein [Pseudomonadales bacterium]MBO6821035.1 FtsX-like permease family protein [Pseudomonadales bacterium]